MKPDNPEEIYLFWYDNNTVWCDIDDSEDKHGVKYIRADLLNEIKAQAIEECLKYAPRYIKNTTSVSFIKKYAKMLRGVKNGTSS